jgi:hypothetical protein
MNEPMRLVLRINRLENGGLDFTVAAATASVEVILVDSESDEPDFVSVFKANGCVTQQDFVEAANDALAEARQDKLNESLDWTEVDNIINNTQ